MPLLANARLIRPDAIWARQWTAWALGVSLGVACLVLMVAPPRFASVSAASAFHEPQSPASAPGTGSIVGSTWNDLDSDAFRDVGEPGLAGVVINARNLESGASFSTTSGVDGEYLMAGLAPGVFRVSATPPVGYALTTQGSADVAMADGIVVTLDFGMYVQPTPTPTPTSLPLLDISGAEGLACGGVYAGDTQAYRNNVSSYACRAWWDESGAEKVYRLEFSATQPVTVTLLTATADLDLFLLRYAYPGSCVAAGDTFLSYTVETGAYYLSVDGYRGARGDFLLRIDCPLELQATATPTFTPSPTPTSTPTGTPAPTFTPSPTIPPRSLYLPLVFAGLGTTPSHRVTFVLQDGLNAYAGTSDTSLNSWTPTTAYGADGRLHLFHSRPPGAVTQMAPALRFDLSMLPVGAVVEQATLRLYMPSTPLHDIRAVVHGLLRSWDERTATWEVAAINQPWALEGAQAIGVDRTEWASPSQQLVEGARWYEFDVTSLSQGWTAEPESNYGLLLNAQAGDSNANVEARFVSREGTAAWRPQLVITYALPTVISSE